MVAHHDISGTEPLFPDLRAFMDRLRAEGDLAVVDAPADPRLEIAEIHRRVIAAGGPALLFTNVRGADFPLVTNLLGTARRARLAFGHRPARLVQRLAQVIETALPPTAGTLWGARDVLREALRVGTGWTLRAPVMEVIDHQPRLDRFPALTAWPEDGGPFLTLPLVYTEHPETGGHNLGLYRMQVHEPDALGIHWQIQKGGGFHYHVAQQRREPLPVTVFLGGPPALILAAAAPLPENVPELLLASLLLGRRLRRKRGLGPHPLVAGAEMALLGRVPPEELRPEGPFGDHYGYYSLRHDYPVMRVDCVARRRDAILPATVVGKPRQEDFFIGDLLQELLSPLFPLAMPGVRKLWAYGETGYHSLAAAVVEERYRREAMRSAFRILGEGQLSLTKFLLVTDRERDLRDFPATLEHVLARSDPRVDLMVFPNLSMDTLDYAGPRVNEGSKGEWLWLGDSERELPRVFSPPAPVPQGFSDACVFCGGCLVVGGPPKSADPEAGLRAAQSPAFDGWQLVVLTDEPLRAARSPINFLWTTFTRFDPATDIHARSQTVAGGAVSREAPIVIDARLGADFPRELFCDPDTAALVSRRWREYFPGGNVEMGDSDNAHLDPAGPTCP